MTWQKNLHASHVLRENINVFARDILRIGSIECVPVTSMTAKVAVIRENRFALVIERSDNGIRDYPFRALFRPL
jgi:hypothetical protein